jgi:hypothetical protein
MIVEELAKILIQNLGNEVKQLLLSRDKHPGIVIE